MDRVREILIGAQGGDHVSIKVGGRDRERWLGTEIEVHCDGWRGKFGANFMSGELGRFGQEIHRLRRSLSGIAELQPLEPNLVLSFAGDGKGHIAVDGAAQNRFHLGTKLVFHFDIDQTYLNQIAEALIEADPAA